MPIPQRHRDHRASPESCLLCDIVLNRFARERQVEPERFVYERVLFYQIGDDVFQLRARAERNRCLFWTNISRQHIEKVTACGARYLGIAYAERTQSELLLLRISPNLLRAVFTENAFPTNRAGEWSFRVRPSDRGGFEFMRAGGNAVVVPQDAFNTLERWRLEEEEEQAETDEYAQAV